MRLMLLLNLTLAFFLYCLASDRNLFTAGARPFVNALQQQHACPNINVDCPDGKSLGDKQIVFKATVPEPVKDQVTYKWSVSRGQIKEGQGTPSITVEAEQGQGSLTATLEVGGLPNDCPNKASCMMSHY